MSNSIKMYLGYINVSLQGQMQYKFSFLMQLVAQFIITCSEFIGIYSLFARFGNIKGWIFPEVAIFYGMIAVAFSINQILSRGFEVTGQLVKSGELDRFLLRPRTTILQLLGFEFALKRIGRLFQGLIVLFYGFSQLAIIWSPLKILFVFWTIAGSCSLFMGLIMIQATISFWTVESLEIMNTMTYGGQEAARYPLPIYKDWFRRFFTYVVPLACINYYPVLFIIGKVDPLGSSIIFQILSPAAGFLFLGVGLIFWSIGIRHYSSTGS